nr:dihydrodipicolinate reductase [Catenulispora rubra]
MADELIPTLVWGTGNIGRAAIRAVAARPGLALCAVLVHDPAKAGRDAGELAGLEHALGVAATSVTSDIEAALRGARAVVYAASGDVRPEEALDDVVRAVRAGAIVVTPALYAFYDPRSAPPDQRERVLAAVAEGGGSLFASGVDPGWANDVLPLMLTGLGTRIEAVRCQEIFDYSTYDQEDSVRYLVGMGQPMEYEPLMTAPGVPTMVWGGQLRLMARALGAELSGISEHVERAPLAEDVETATMGKFAADTQGGVRFEVRGEIGGVPRIVIEHVTRIHGSVAPQWPQAPDGVGAHRVVIEGRPRIEVTVEAADEGGNRSAGGNATAVGRLVGAIGWLAGREPGLYDALDVPITPAAGVRWSTEGTEQ